MADYLVTIGLPGSDLVSPADTEWYYTNCMVKAKVKARLAIKLNKDTIVTIRKNTGNKWKLLYKNKDGKLVRARKGE